jgi:OCT family organic cation transporter-like MFS transporter 4/5
VLYQLIFTVMEVTGPNHRTMVGQVVQIWVGVGGVILAVLAYYLRDYRTLELVVNSAGIVFIVYFW